MPVITFPKGPNTDEPSEEQELDKGEVEDSLSAYFVCTECGGSVFYAWTDGEAECVKCGTVATNILVIDLDGDPTMRKRD